MTTTIEVSRGRLASVIRKANTSGYHTLNAAELAVIHAYDAQTLRVVPNSHRVNGCEVGAFYQSTVQQ
jgi:hypothetical protein